MTGDGLPPSAEWKHGRAKTIQLRRLTNDERKIEALLYPEHGYWRPSTRGECSNVQRPCPYVGCRHHLYVDEGTGESSLVLNFPEQEPWEMPVSCSLDVADEHPSGLSLDQIGRVMGVTRERVRQIQKAAETKAVRRAGKDGAAELRAFLEERSRTRDPWDGF